MRNPALEALWRAYMDNDISGVKPLMSYDLKDVDKQLQETFKKLKLKGHEQELLVTIVLEYLNISEHHGFDSGIKTGIMLSQRP